jgi:hypothetical protein
MKKILIITNKDDITVDFVIKELKRRKVDYYRLNTECIPNECQIVINVNEKVCKIIDLLKGREMDLRKFDSIYYRRPLLSDLTYMSNVNKEEIAYLRSELTFVLEGVYRILDDKFWLNNVYDIRVAENKIYQLQLAQTIGFSIPKTVLSNNGEIISSFIEKNNDDCIIKPIKSGNLKSFDDSSKAIFTSMISKDEIENVKNVDCFPMYLQNRISKKYDIRCTVVGNEVFSAQIHSQTYDKSRIDWRRSDIALEHQKHDLPQDIAQKCIDLTKALNLNYSAIDFVLDTEGKYTFLELNPNGQWAWIEKRLGFNIAESIVNLLMEG